MNINTKKGYPYHQRETRLYKSNSWHVTKSAKKAKTQTSRSIRKEKNFFLINNFIELVIGQYWKVIKRHLLLTASYDLSVSCFKSTAR